jgi:oxygen-dependent protoporphyrinogen oxidase
MKHVRETAIAEVNSLLGISGAPTFCHHRHWPKAIPQYKLGYGEILDQIESIENQFPGLRVKGNYRDGISLSDCIKAGLS